MNGGKIAVASDKEIAVYTANGKESKKTETEHSVSEIFWCSSNIFTVENGHLCKY